MYIYMHILYTLFIYIMFLHFWDTLFDDPNICYSGHNMWKLHERITNELQKIYQWLCIGKLSRNLEGKQIVWLSQIVIY